MEQEKMGIQRNTRQQNAVTQSAMLATARRYRTEGVAHCIGQFFAERGIEIDRAAIVHVVPGCVLGCRQGLGGVLVTEQGQFVSFELELDDALSRIEEVHELADVTALQNFSAHNRGTGTGVGALALAVLQMMNSN